MAKKQKSKAPAVDRVNLIKEARKCACHYLQIPSGVGTLRMKQCTDAELQEIIDVQLVPYRVRRQLIKAVLTRVADRVNSPSATKEPAKN